MNQDLDTIARKLNRIDPRVRHLIAEYRNLSTDLKQFRREVRMTTTAKVAKVKLESQAEIEAAHRGELGTAERDEVEFYDDNEVWVDEERLQDWRLTQAGKEI